ncbi:hypothetical protein O181_011072 [Austropuccinia psidii MF-1]|uniref:Uncharacterized protein n=1 Tax=Austropuccinia psidii MF-1 TaxID=1389203 RepID=A0A9Q3GLS8_9BASI|nr:hypothetical protein [Austropuccinia psidii MF-1]
MISSPNEVCVPQNCRNTWFLKPTYLLFDLKYLVPLCTCILLISIKYCSPFSLLQTFQIYSLKTLKIINKVNIKYGKTQYQRIQ